MNNKTTKIIKIINEMVLKNRKDYIRFVKIIIINFNRMQE